MTHTFSLPARRRRRQGDTPRLYRRGKTPLVEIAHSMLYSQIGISFLTPTTATALQYWFQTPLMVSPWRTTIFQLATRRTPLRKGASCRARYGLDAAWLYGL